MLEPSPVAWEGRNLAAAPIVGGTETEVVIGGQSWRLGHLLAMTETLFPEPPATIRVGGGDPLACWLGVLYALRHGCRLILGAGFTAEAAEVRLPAGQQPTAEQQPFATPASADLIATLNGSLNSTEPRVALATSGSTGEPTLVWKSWQVLAAEAASLSQFYHSPATGAPQPSAEKIISLVPPIHIYGLLHGILLPLISGRALIQVADVSLGLSPAEQARLSQNDNALLVTTPASWSRARQLIAAGQVATLVSSAGAFGEKRHLELVAAVADRPVAAYELYGSTETGGLAWQDLLRFDGFTPFPEVTITHAAEGASAHSPYIYPDGRWLLQDRLAAEPGGKFRVLGRRDRVFKYGGKRYSLAAVAARLAAAAGLEPAQVVCDFEEGADRAKGGRLWAYLEMGSETSEQASLVELRTRFLALGEPPLPFPDKLVALAELPRTALGKVSLAELRKLRS